MNYITSWFFCDLLLGSERGLRFDWQRDGGVKTRPRPSKYPAGVPLK